MKRPVIVLVILAGNCFVTGQQQKTAQVSGQSSLARPNLELRLTASQVSHGLPRLFTFVLVNRSDHPVLLPPQPSLCIGLNGTINLAMTFTPLKGEVTGWGSGCGSNVSFPPILDRLKSWKRLEPGESLSVPYEHDSSKDFGMAAGTYDFSGTYEPPKLTPEDIATLEQAGIDFPRQTLTSNHLRFSTDVATRTHN